MDGTGTILLIVSFFLIIFYFFKGGGQPFKFLTSRYSVMVFINKPAAPKDYPDLNPELQLLCGFVC